MRLRLRLAAVGLGDWRGGGAARLDALGYVEPTVNRYQRMGVPAPANEPVWVCKCGGGGRVFVPLVNITNTQL